MRSNPFLLVGFGGAGLRTLDAFDAMVAANSSHAHQLRENIYYFAVDTEQAAIQAFQESILRRSNGARGPYTTTCCLSENIQNFDEIVRPVFDRFYGRPNDVGLSRLREHWWFDADGRPFRGRDGLNVMYGSGMSPVVAFTLAWHQMRMIEEKVGEILDNIKRRSMACMGPISRMRIYFVTSLAGGTGRGSWAPVMLKVKEVLRDRYRAFCHTTGLFFDASIFGDFFQGAPSEALTHKVNSLTGLSELSFWIGDNMRGMCEMPIPFGLPDMMSPANPEKDVLKFGEEKFLCSRSPVDNAYLICRQSSACGRLDSHNDYFQMAGRGLFALYESDDIEVRHINDLRMIRSFAITALTVDVVGLRAYFNYLARKSVLADIISECGDVDVRVDEFLKRIFFPPSIREESDIRPDLNGTLMQRACANLNASKGEEYSRLRKQLSLLQSKRASSGVQSLSRSVVDSVTEIDVNNAVSLAVESLRARFNGKGLDLRRELVLEVRAICMGDEGEKLSVGRVRKFLQQLLQKMDGLTNSSITEFSFSDPLAPDSVDKLSAREWIDRVFYKFSKRTLLEAITGRSPFNADKVSELVHESDSGWGGLVPRVVLCDIYPRLREKLLDFFEPLQTLVHAILDSCDSVLAWSEKADALLSKRLMCEVGCRTHEELFHRIFTTPDRMFEELPSVDSMAIHCQTILKPIVRDCQEVNEFLLKSDDIKYYKCRIGDLLLNALNCCTDDGPRLRGDGGVHEESMAEEDIFEAIIDNVNVSDSFVEKRFSLFKVLTQNREYWNCQIMIMAGDCYATNIFNDKLRALLGVMPKRSGAGELYELPSAEDLLISATCMLVQRCHPWWNLGCEAGGTDCYVTVPESESERHQHCLDVIRSRLDRHVAVFGRQSYVTVDPYSVVAFVVQVPSERREDGHIFDSIKSFDYWKTPEILEKLREAERADGKLIFSRGQHRGIGYMSPRFVQDPQLSSMRWKPWAETESKDEMTLRQTSNPIGGDTIDSARTNQSDVFISYSRRDLDVVKPIKEELERNGFSCWMDIDGIESGDENFKQKIVPAIDGCCVVLFFISAVSQKSEWTAKELGYAKRHGKRVVPLRFNDDPLVGVFDFDYGDADIIDWRQPEQKAKLLDNLRAWANQANETHSPTATQKPSDESVKTQPDVSFVVCPICGKKNRPVDTFRCRVCGRDNLCIRHQDEATFLCSDCKTRTMYGGVGAPNSPSAFGDTHKKVQLWENGPYWAETNIGAENPWDPGYYFWWGDTVGYKREGDIWVASDGASSGFSFSKDNTPTYDKDKMTLLREGWITADGVLVPNHDVAHVQWGGEWRMSTQQELRALCNKCDWTWVSMNGVNGYVVRGRGDYASASIFLPAAGFGRGSSLCCAGSNGNYWSSDPGSGSPAVAWRLNFNSSGHYTYSSGRFYGRPVRPVQGFDTVSSCHDGKSLK